MATARLKARADAHPAPTKSFTSGLSGGVADSLDEAKAAFRAAWEEGGQGRLSFQKSGRELVGASPSVDDPVLT
jgi:hypothetical protein